MENNPQMLDNKTGSVSLSETDKMSLPTQPLTNRESELTQEKDITISHHVHDQVVPSESLQDIKEDENSKKITLDSESEKKEILNENKAENTKQNKNCRHIEQAKKRLKHLNNPRYLKTVSHELPLTIQNTNQVDIRYIDNGEVVQVGDDGGPSSLQQTQTVRNNRSNRFKQPTKDLRASSPMLSKFMKKSRQLFTGLDTHSSSIHPEPIYNRKFESRSVYKLPKKRKHDDKTLNPYCVVDYEDEDSEEEENLSLKFWNKKNMIRSASHQLRNDKQLTPPRKFLEELKSAKKNNEENLAKTPAPKRVFKYLVTSSVQTDSEQNVKSFDTSSRPLGRGLEQFLKSRRENLRQNWSEVVPQSYYNMEPQENDGISVSL
jgi:hypothetical protein